MLFVHTIRKDLGLLGPHQLQGLGPWDGTLGWVLDASLDANYFTSIQEQCVRSFLQDSLQHGTAGLLHMCAEFLGRVTHNQFWNRQQSTRERGSFSSLFRRLAGLPGIPGWRSVCRN